MSIRWVIIIGILLWLIYEYTQHMWISIWQIDSKTIKCGIGVLLIVILLLAPSIEDLVKNTNVHDFLKKIMVRSF